MNPISTSTLAYPMIDRLVDERTCRIERSLTDQPQFVLSGRESFTESDASILLYGADNRKGVVAIEPSGPYEVEIFLADGWKKRWSERHAGKHKGNGGTAAADPRKRSETRHVSVTGRQPNPDCRSEHRARATSACEAGWPSSPSSTLGLRLVQTTTPGKCRLWAPNSRHSIPSATCSTAVTLSLTIDRILSINSMHHATAVSTCAERREAIAHGCQSTR